MEATPIIYSGRISTADALWTLIQSQSKAVRKALVKRILDEDIAAEKQKAALKESLTTAFNELQSGQAKHDARNLFARNLDRG